MQETDAGVLPVGQVGSRRAAAQGCWHTLLKLGVEEVKTLRR